MVIPWYLWCHNTAESQIFSWIAPEICCKDFSWVQVEIPDNTKESKAVFNYKDKNSFKLQLLKFKESRVYP